MGAITVFRSRWPICPSFSLPLSSHIRISGPIRCSSFSSNFSASCMYHVPIVAERVWASPVKTVTEAWCGDLVGQRFKSGILVARSLVHIYANCASVDDALVVFGRMEERDLMEHTDVWTCRAWIWAGGSMCNLPQMQSEGCVLKTKLASARDRTMVTTTLCSLGTLK